MHRSTTSHGLRRAALPALAAALALIAGPALADVGPKPPHCRVPSSCVSCPVHFGDPDAGQDCRASAVDAGLVDSACVDSVGAGATHYYCPPGVTATRPCGCSASGGAGALGLLAGSRLARRRRQR